MKKVLGVILILTGILLGLYLGLWVCFIGGIVQIINEFKSAHEVIAMNIAIGIVRFFSSALVGWISALIFIIPGIKIMKRKKYSFF